ncbi:DUF2029 domain-containing protein [Amycolatopsis suaedae]|uniref:DUF2029 domain-containing protein n=1 Tax=Amycolatopsis suaedae TaxID=2510978 RepID=A0A4V2ELN6_9PSEU|nr:DUF2029 domain-containing protein [Amycolatopsis suaedae]
MLAALAYLLFSRHLIDDSYITFSYAENLALHGHWGLVEQGTSNTATSPLNVLALAAVTFVVRDAVVAGGVLFVLAQVLTFTALRELGGRYELPAWFAPVTVALLALNPLLLSSVGLEIALGVAGVSWLLVFADARRPWAAGVVVGLLALLRLDLLVMAAVILVLRKRFWDGLWRSAVAALAVALPWFGFSWLVLGSAVPDTLVIKTLQRTWGEWGFTNGPLLYVEHYGAPAVLSWLPLATAVVAGLVWLVRRPRLTPFVGLIAAGLAHFLAYSWLDVPPYHWYYGPSIAAATVFTVAVVATFQFRVVVAAPVALAVAFGWVYVAPGLPRDAAPITSNHATSEQYLAIGRDLNRVAAGRAVTSAGEIGVLAHACHCEILDVFSDRGAIGPAIEQRRAEAGPFSRALLDLNFRFLNRDVQPKRAPLTLATTTGAVPPGTLASWRISSPWTGERTLYVVPASTG